MILIGSDSDIQEFVVETRFYKTLSSPVSPVVHLQPGEDWAAGDQGTRQAAEPAQVRRQQLPHRLLQQIFLMFEIVNIFMVWSRAQRTPVQVFAKIDCVMTAGDGRSVVFGNISHNISQVVDLHQA